MLSSKLFNTLDVMKHSVGELCNEFYIFISKLATTNWKAWRYSFPFVFVVILIVVESCAKLLAVYMAFVSAGEQASELILLVFSPCSKKFLCWKIFLLNSVWCNCLFASEIKETLCFSPLWNDSIRSRFLG